MINNKIRKIFSPAAGLMSILMVMGTVSMPVYAADDKIEYAYNQSLLDKDMLSGNNVIEQNGVKLVVTNIEACKNKIKVTMDLYTNKDDSDSLMYNDLDIRVYMNNIQQTGSSGGRSGCKNGKISIDEEIENEDGYPEKGIIRIDAVDGKIGLNGTLKIPVDFTEDFKKVLSKDINMTVKNNNGNEFNMEKFVSNSFETSILLSQPEKNDISFAHSIRTEDMSFLVNIDGSIYKADFPNSSYSSDGKEYDQYCLEGLTYDKVNNSDKITIRQLTNSMSEEEIDDFYKNRREDMEKEPDEDENGVKYNKKVEFNDGSEGSFKVVREDSKVKIYCSSDSDLKSMLMATNLYGVYMDNEEYFDGLEGSNVYKDKDNNYVAEFDDVQRDKKITINMNPMICNIDKFSLGDEIEVK